MSAALTRPGELGTLASEAIAELITRSGGGASVSTYAESESPLTWATIADGGWDMIGTDDDAQLRDLAELARAWGRSCLPLALIPSILAKRHSTAAQQVDGPVSFSVPSSTVTSGGIILFGQGDVKVARGLGAGEDLLEDVPPGSVRDDFDILSRAVLAPYVSEFSGEVAREAAVLFAAEASGAAARLLDDGVSFVKERHQFGKPVGSFQAVKHHLANALIRAELAETAVIWASLHPEEAFRGALSAIEHSIAVGELVLQVHGGIGFTWELGLHYFLRRLVASRDIVTGLEAAHA